MSISLAVKDAKQTDSCSGFVRVNQKVINQLGINENDPVFIIGQGKTAALVLTAHNEDQDNNIIRIDEYTRKNAGVEINEFVEIMKADPINATFVDLSPVGMKLKSDSKFIDFVRNQLLGKVFVEGNIVTVMFLGFPMTLRVERAKPNSGCFRLVETTTIRFLASSFIPVDNLSAELKALLRFQWLDAVSDRLKTDHIIFSRPHENANEDVERKIMQSDKGTSEGKVSLVSLAVNLYSSRGDLIGTLPWAILHLDESIKPTCPENKKLRLR